MQDFISGALMMGLAIAGGFFLRFYRQTADRLFAYFAVAFWTMAVSRVALALVPSADEVRPLFYLLRLAAFVMILAAIVDKNRSRAPRRTRARPGPGRELG
jgi:hypothetical protein